MAYRDAPAMIGWLCDTFGFEKKAIYTDADGKVMHSELTFGNGMIMIGSAKSGTPSSGMMTQPGEIGGGETRAIYLVVADCDAVYARSKRAGAKIVRDLEEKSYGGKAFTCADPEGHIWHIGTYDPWQ